MSSYFILYNSGEDEAIWPEGPLTQSEVQAKLEEWRTDELDVTFIEDVNELGDFNGPHALIIKGEIVIPKPVRVVKEYEIP